MSVFLISFLQFYHLKLENSFTLENKYAETLLEVTIFLWVLGLAEKLKDIFWKQPRQGGKVISERQ